MSVPQRYHIFIHLPTPNAGIHRAVAESLCALRAREKKEIGDYPPPGSGDEWIPLRDVKWSDSRNISLASKIGYDTCHIQI